MRARAVISLWILMVASSAAGAGAEGQTWIVLSSPDLDDRIERQLNVLAAHDQALIRILKNNAEAARAVPGEGGLTIELRPEAGEVWRVLDRLIGPQNKTLNETNPSINAKLPATPANPGGGRIKALHPIIAPPGRNPSINIRLYEQKPVKPEWLLERGVMNQEMMDILQQAMEKGDRILISGGTRTGKPSARAHCAAGSVQP